MSGYHAKIRERNLCINAQEAKALLQRARRKAGPDVLDDVTIVLVCDTLNDCPKRKIRAREWEQCVGFLRDRAQALSDSAAEDVQAVIRYLERERDRARA